MAWEYIYKNPKDQSFSNNAKGLETKGKAFEGRLKNKSEKLRINISGS